MIKTEKRDNIISPNYNFNNEYNKKSHKKIIIITVISLVLILALITIIYYIAGIPIIKYKGEKIENIDYGETYNDKGIIVYSKFKNISDKVIIESNVDTSKIGTYSIIYKVPYLKKNKIYTRTVNVEDKESPSINLLGDIEYTMEYGNEYVEPGYTAIDNYDGDITSNVIVTKKDIDENNFEIHYKVTDSSGNNFECIRHIKITDNTAPKITLNGNSVVSIITGTTYNEQGATAIDNKDGDISNNIQIFGNVDVSKDGIYKIKYEISDSNGNKSTAQRSVIVSQTQVSGIIYLTFDDGPTSNMTPKILDVLKEKNVKATFFIINYNNDTEYLVKRAIEEGNAIGIHGYSHDYSQIYTSVDVCYENITKLQQKIYNSTGITTKILRFPGGSSNTVSKKYCEGIMTKISQKVLDEGFKYYDWNVLSGDAGDAKTKEQVYNNVINGIKPGRSNIILMHDTSKNDKTLQALPGIIDYGISNGYIFEIITTDTEMITQKIQN